MAAAAADDGGSTLMFAVGKVAAVAPVGDPDAEVEVEVAGVTPREDGLGDATDAGTVKSCAGRCDRREGPRSSAGPSGPAAVIPANAATGAAACVAASGPPRHHPDTMASAAATAAVIR